MAVAPARLQPGHRRGELFGDSAPLGAAARLVGHRGRVLLHSGRDDDHCGRWSFVSCEPSVTLEARGDELTIRDRCGQPIERRRGDPLAALEEMLRAAGGDAVDSRQGPVPTAIGYLGYDLGRTIERLPAGPELGADLPDMWIGFYGAVLRFDAERGDVTIVGRDAPARERLAAALASGPSGPGAAPILAALVPDYDAESYRRRVQRVLDYIYAGDVYQVNLARRLVAPVVARGDPLAMYAALVARSPSPFGAMIESDSAAILSGSPERFLARAPGSARLETRPIKGTRRRVGDPRADGRAAQELGLDEKERAEHLMIVDLERNDLGRVATIGSVQVEGLGYVVELPTLYHMVSTVSCQVRERTGLADILRATFPGGSITGAPKIRAMEIIDELEPARRGPYTGAIGYFGAGGSMDLSIAIRITVMTEDQVRLHVGGGIVADSTAERELEETEEKAAAWRAALAALPPAAPAIRESKPARPGGRPVVALRR